MKADLKTLGDMPKPCAHLSGLALELEYVKSRGLAYLRCSEDNFAMFNRETNELTIFGESIEITASSFHTNEAAEVLRDAQTLGATFTIKDGGRCHCCIEDVQCDGDTYVEAALRALIAYRTK